MQHTLQEIPDLLGPLFYTQRETEIEIWKLERTIAKRQIDLVPAEGWPGKNEDARNQARDSTFAHDGDLLEYRDEMLGLKEKLAKTEAEIDTLDAERRALEWAIRSQLAGALEHYGVHKNNRKSDPAEAGFDDAALSGADVATDAALQPTPEPIIEDYDFPF